MTTRKKKPGRRQLPPPTNQQVSLKVAADYTKRYQRSAPASEKAGFFFAEGLKALLGQPGVYGMRIYHGLDDTGQSGRLHLGRQRQDLGIDSAIDGLAQLDDERGIASRQETRRNGRTG